MLRALKLSEKLFYWLLGFVILVNLINSFIEYRSSRALIIKHTKFEIEEYVSGVLNDLNSSLLSAKSVAGNTAVLLQHFDLSEKELIILIKKILEKEEKIYGCGFFFEPETNFKIQDKNYLYFHKCPDSIQCYTQTILHNNFHSTKWHQALHNQKDVAFSGIYQLDERLEQSIKSYAVPIGKANSETYKGFVKIDIETDEFFSVTNQKNDRLNRSILFFDSKGDLLYQAGDTLDSDQIDQDTDLRYFLNCIKDGHKGFLPQKEYKRNQVVHLSPINEFGVNLAVVFPISIVTKPIQRLFFVISLISLLTIIIAGFIIRFLARKLLKPLTDLTAAANNINQGKYHTQIPEHSKNDEIGSLSNSVKSMQDKMLRYAAGFNKTLKEKRRMEHDVQFAKRVQTSMLPMQNQSLTWCANVDIFVKFFPAKGVAGDFYDYFFINSHTLFFIIGDVSGKGIPASLFMVKSLTLIKNEARKTKDPAHIFSSITTLLSENNDDSLFVTAICGTLDVITGELILCDAGHNPPMFSLNHENFKLEHFQKNIPLGVLSDYKYKSSRYLLENGDTMIFYTDGLSEGENPESAMYETDRMLKSVHGKENKELSVIYNHLKSDFESFVNSAPQSDDITIMILRFMDVEKNPDNKSSSELLSK